MSGTLTDKQRRFVEEYMVDFNATQAAIRAGYSKRSARQQGLDALAIPGVAQALAKAKLALSIKTDITVQDITREYAVLGFSDMRNYVSFEKNGDILLDWSAMPPEATKAISEITQEVYYEGKGEAARQVKKTKFKLYDKRGALDSLSARLWPVVQRNESVALIINVDLMKMVEVIGRLNLTSEQLAAWAGMLEEPVNEEERLNG